MREIAHKALCYLRIIISQHPREDRILHQVIVRAACQCVKMHQVLEICYFTTLMKQAYKQTKLHGVTDEG